MRTTSEWLAMLNISTKNIPGYFTPLAPHARLPPELSRAPFLDGGGGGFGGFSTGYNSGIQSGAHGYYHGGYHGDGGQRITQTTPLRRGAGGADLHGGVNGFMQHAAARAHLVESTTSHRYKYSSAEEMFMRETDERLEALARSTDFVTERALYL